MSVKQKLLYGFGSIIAMIVILGGMGWFALSSSSSGFKEYREMAKDSVLTGRVQANLLMVRMNVKDYLNNPIQKEIDEFNSYYDKTRGFMDEALKEIQKPTRAPMVKTMSDDLNIYKESFLKVIEFMNKRNDVVNNNLDINGKKIENLLTAVMRSAKKDRDIDAALETAEGIRTLLLARLYAAKFIKSNAVADKERAMKEFDILEHELADIQKQIQNKKRISQLKEAVKLIKTYEHGLTDLVKIISDRNEIINNKLNKIGPKIAKIAEDVKLSIKKDQDRIGPEVQNSNDTFMTLITILSLIIIGISIMFAILIPKLVINSLESVSIGLVSFFDFLNRKTKTANPIELDTSDEFGTMAKMVNENITSIQTTLKQDEELINEVKQVVNKVEAGDLNVTVNGSTSNESLNELKSILNQMLNTLKTNVASDLNKVSNALKEYSNKNFTQKIDDNGEMAKSINHLIDIINTMLAENLKNGLTLDASSNILLKNVDTLNKNSNEAAASLEETAAALEEVTSNILSTNENVVKMANYANDVTKASGAGQDLANKTTTSMDEINEQVTAINEAITVIDQIAFQTNILSLNAAVEAATAGEAGKGFAVVAQEVRNLAARSAEAAKEIKDIVEKANQKANEGKTIANNMIEGYTGLNESITKTIDLIKDVESASKEQQSAIVQINDAVNSLDQQTQENASIASQTHEVAVKTDEIAKLVVANTNESDFIGKGNVKADTTSSSAQINQSPKKEVTIPAPKAEMNPTPKAQPKTIASNTSDDEWESF
jgi:methyl-accepting chemotaxis protein